VKKKVLVLSDHPFSFSGVGIQTRYFIEAILKSGKYQVMALGGAIKHADYRPVKTQEYGDDFVVHPVDGYGTPDLIRSVVRAYKPDVVWFMTDPRFWEWLWQMEDEIRALCPMVYYHVWDNYPYPQFNAPFYKSNDMIVTISKVTDDIVKTVTPEVKSTYLPHAVDTNVFKILDEATNKANKEKSFGKNKDKFIFFWNNRNARRKMSGSIVHWFNNFLNKVGRDKAMLLMHTNPKDENGQDLEAIAKDLGMNSDEILFSTGKLNFDQLAALYNMVDCTINISDAEGFGMATMESICCGTPIIVNMTGGLQEQVTDGKKWFGIGIKPTSKAVIGSQQVPYIYEDRVSEEDFVKALETMFNMPADKRKKMAEEGREYISKKYGFENFNKRWVEIMDQVVEENGSWDTRKNYERWSLQEVK
jgi:glycosyltransferase involved in cell wall biosynthesis